MDLSAWDGIRDPVARAQAMIDDIRGGRVTQEQLVGFLGHPSGFLCIHAAAVLMQRHRTPEIVAAVSLMLLSPKASQPLIRPATVGHYLALLLERTGHQEIAARYRERMGPEERDFYERYFSKEVDPFSGLHPPAG